MSMSDEVLKARARKDRVVRTRVTKVTWARMEEAAQASQQTVTQWQRGAFEAALCAHEGRDEEQRRLELRVRELECAVKAAKDLLGTLDV